MRTFALAAAALLATTAFAQTKPVFTPESFKAHVAFLADDLLEGRDTGSRGHRIASAYVASQFEGLGLKPAGENGSWYQEVPFRSARLTGAKPTFTLTTPNGTRTWENATDVLIGPDMQAQKRDVTAPVVFVGYGLEAPSLGVDDYKGLDVRGKIVAYISGTPRNLPSEIAASLGNDKSATAARHGAIGTITIPTAELLQRRPWARGLGAANGARLAWIGKDGQAYIGAQGIQVSASLNAPAAEALFAGAPKSYAQLDAEVAKGGRPKGFPLKATVRITRETEWTEIKSPETIGMLEGADPALKGEYVVLMAHVDHLGLKKNAKPGEDAIYNGALDNAAGTATMLEVARAFKESGQRPRRSILFIANTAEEKGLLGAEYFARNPTVPIGQIVGLVDLDMPLLLYPFTDVIAFGADHSTVAKTVAAAAGSMDVKLAADPMPEESIFTRSDHYKFVREGVPAIMLATGYSNGGAEKWKAFLGGDYHGVGDDMKQPILWDQGARFADLNYRITRDLADADQRPQWYKGDYFGDLFAPNAPKAAK